MDARPSVPNSDHQEDPMLGDRAESVGDAARGSTRIPVLPSAAQPPNPAAGDAHVK
jgi:hypothetical protein